jgi:hypothetical protein
LSLFGPGDIHEGSTPLECAYRYLGVQESGGPNRGPLIDQWLRRVKLEPDPAKNDKAPKGGYPWCSAFACAMCHDGGRPLPSPSASVARLWERNGDALAVGLNDLQSGDLVLRLTPGETHVAFYVRRPRPGRIETLDGNSNESGSRDGRDVVIKERSEDFWQAALRPIASR